MNDLAYEGRLVRVTDRQGRIWTGIAERCPGESEPGRAGEALRVGKRQLRAEEIEKLEFLPSFEEAAAAIPPGRYRHFKGNEYEVLCVARHSETTEPMVVYRALYGEGGVWVRPAEMWTQTVEWQGRTCRRFEPLQAEEAR